MKVSYDKESDALWIKFREDAPGRESGRITSEEVMPNVIIDVDDKTKKVVAIEILFVSKTIGKIKV